MPKVLMGFGFGWGIGFAAAALVAVISGKPGPSSLVAAAIRPATDPAALLIPDAAEIIHPPQP